MRVILIRYHDTGDVNTRLPVSLNRIRGIMPPLGLAYIASALENAGHSVKILDAQASGYLRKDIELEIRQFRPGLVGVTSMTSNFMGALEAAEIAKTLGLITVVGGPTLEAFPEETLSYDCIDFGIVSEGEISFVKLIDAIENKKPLNEIAGLVYKENGIVKVTPPSLIDDIDKLPLPARHLLPMKRYSSIISRDPMTTMITSRGCPYLCSFCFKQFADKRVRFRNPVSVVDEMELLIKDYGVREIMFYDDSILANLSHIEGICKEILKRGLKVRWESPSRVNNVNMELLRLMRASGCIRLRYGVESGDKDILSAMNKQTDPEMVRKAFELTHAAGIEAFAYFMVGYLNETRDAFERSLGLIKKIKADQIMVTLTTPYPKTALEKEAIARSRMPSDYWRDFVLQKTKSSLPPLVKEAENWIRQAYWDFYFRPGYITKRLRHINSYNQLKKHILAGAGLFLFKLR